MKKSTAFGLVTAILLAVCLVGAVRKFSAEVRQRVVTIGAQCAEDGWRMAHEHQTLEQTTNAVATSLKGALQ